MTNYPPRGAAALAHYRRSVIAMFVGAMILELALMVVGIARLPKTGGIVLVVISAVAIVTQAAALVWIRLAILKHLASQRG